MDTLSFRWTAGDRVDEAVGLKKESRYLMPEGRYVVAGQVAFGDQIKHDNRNCRL